MKKTFAALALTLFATSALAQGNDLLSALNAFDYGASSAFCSAVDA